MPRAIDVHAHLGISVFLAREIDLSARTPRVRHLLDCDASEPGCPLDLDVYMNANFSDADLRRLRIEAVRQGIFGGGAATSAADSFFFLERAIGPRRYLYWTRRV